MNRLQSCLTAALVAAPAFAFAAPPFALGEKETIVFAGDSITAAGHYVRYVEGYLATRFPDRTFRVVNSGLSSETVAGLTEAGRSSPRPTLFARFDKAVSTHAPTWIVACYGMNDGIYHPFSDERFGCYQQGIGQLIANSRSLKARTLLLTPPVCDLAGRELPPLGAGESHSFKRPAPDYDAVLERYAEWLASLKDTGLDVADVHLAFKAHLAARRETTPEFRLSPDSVHPNETGHMLMAMAVLAAWNAPALASEATVDAAAGKVVAGEVSALQSRKGGVSFTWKAVLPMPVDEKWDADSVALERVTDRFSRHQLAVTGLPPGRYTLEADGAAIGTYSAGELATGLDLNALREFPTTRQSAQVLTWLSRRGPEGGAPPAEMRGPRTVKIAVRRTAGKE
jgi:lysophospholipase L1-like esterase